MQSVSLYLSMTNYSDSVASMTNAVDFMLAEFPMTNELVNLANTVKLKFTCVGMLLKKGYYDDAFTLDDDARIDMVFLLESLGLKTAAVILIDGLLGNVDH